MLNGIVKLIEHGDNKGQVRKAEFVREMLEK